MKPRISPVSGFLIALSLLAADQIAKYLIKTSMGPFDVIRVLPFFNIVYVENVGSAFGMFKGLGNLFFILVALAAIVFVSVLMVKDGENRLMLSLILGGAAGNLVDRLVRGYVIDFLDLYAGRFHWPAFNVADSALTVGVALLAVRTFMDGKRTDRHS